MTDNELEKNMDVLGQMIHEKECKEFQFQMENKELFEKIEYLKDVVKREILKRGTGHDSFKLKCSYRRGAIRWDNKALDSYGVDHPEIMKFRKQGEPTVGFSVRSEGLFD